MRLGGTHEVAGLLDVSKQRVHQLAETPGFPAPLARLNAGAVWDLDDIDKWAGAHRAMSNNTPRMPDRDPERPADDPWDADAVRYLMRFTDRPRGWLMEHLRGQKRLDQAKVAEARSLADQHGVEYRAHSDGKTVHLFRTDQDAPTPYPSSEAERRAWRAEAG